MQITSCARVRCSWCCRTTCCRHDKLCVRVCVNCLTFCRRSVSVAAVSKDAVVFAEPQNNKTHTKKHMGVVCHHSDGLRTNICVYICIWWPYPAQIKDGSVFAHLYPMCISMYTCVVCWFAKLFFCCCCAGHGKNVNSWSMPLRRTIALIMLAAGTKGEKGGWLATSN